VPGAVGRDHDRDAQPGPAGGIGHRVEDQVGERGDPAEAGRVAAGVDLDLQPDAPVGDVVLGGLEHQPADVALGPQHRAGHVVQALEPEPALLVGRGQHRRPVLDQRVGQVDAVARGELDQGRVPHRPREVEVQVRLGQASEVPATLHPQAKSFWSRVMPSTRSSSPSA
jgi:hypothetical protein